MADLEDLGLLTVLVVVLATYRLTLLIVADNITKRPRRWLVDRAPSSRLAYFITCPWCTSWWIAILVTWSAMAWGNGWGWQLPAVAMAASGATGFLASYASPDG